MANEINIDLGKRRSLKANIGAPGYLGRGDAGTGIARIDFIGNDKDGGNVYRVYLTDDTYYDITAPKGAPGSGGSGGGSNEVWLPAVSDGVLTWTKSDSDIPPAPANIKGDAGLRWRGEYDDFTTYAKGDAVSSNGSSFIFVSEFDVEGAIPGIDPEWELLASCGADYRLTASDKSEITQAVLSAMPSWKGGAY